MSGALPKIYIMLLCIQMLPAVVMNSNRSTTREGSFDNVCGSIDAKAHLPPAKLASTSLEVPGMISCTVFHGLNRFLQLHLLFLLLLLLLYRCHSHCRRRLCHYENRCSNSTFALLMGSSSSFSYFSEVFSS